MWPVVPLIQSDCGILWSSWTLEDFQQSLRYFSWRYSSSKVSIWDYLFWLDVSSCSSHPILLQDPLTINILERVKWYLSFCCICRQSSKQESIYDYHSCLGVARCASRPIRIRILWSSISVEGISRYLCLSILNLIYSLAFIIKRTTGACSCDLFYMRLCRPCSSTL